MRRITIFLCMSLLFCFKALAQPDTIATNKGDIIIHPIVHGTLAVQYDGKTIYVDPYGGASGFESLPAADLILITDIHGDHCDSSTLVAVNAGETQLIVPQAVARKLNGHFGEPRILDNGKKTKWQGITIEAVPMYNLPESPDSRHTKGRGNGYILNLGDKRIYISGDTEDIEEMRKLQKIDIAFVCMNLPYTMSVDQAADAVNAFRPGIVYPYHYRGKDGLSDVDHFKELLEEDYEASNVEVRLRNWYVK